MAPQNVSALSREEKVKEAILRSTAYMPGDVAAQFKAFLTPRNLSFMVATLVGLAVAQAFGVGEFADALLIAALGFCGWGAVDGCKDLY
ncbi:hypothetical protein [Terriglobus sp.]|uniref:hypothetical protein n=1 Tax=Terriglobus sp. TaxID=1889013 RepID=UPI003AFFF02E